MLNEARLHNNARQHQQRYHSLEFRPTLATSHITNANMVWTLSKHALQLLKGCEANVDQAQVISNSGHDDMIVCDRKSLIRCAKGSECL